MFAISVALGAASVILVVLYFEQGQQMYLAGALGAFIFGLLVLGIDVKRDTVRKQFEAVRRKVDSLTLDNTLLLEKLGNIDQKLSIVEKGVVLNAPFMGRISESSLAERQSAFTKTRVGESLTDQAKESEKSRSDMSCPKCGSAIQRDFKYCPVCSASLEVGTDEPVAASCPSCGQKISTDYSFCPYCSLRLEKVCPGCYSSVKLDCKSCAYCGHTLQASSFHDLTWDMAQTRND